MKKRKFKVTWVDFVFYGRPAYTVRFELMVNNLWNVTVYRGLRDGRHQGRVVFPGQAKRASVKEANGFLKLYLFNYA